MSDSQDPPVNCTRQGPILLVEMRRPETGNALSWELQRGLVAAWEELESEDDLLVGVLHGTGGDFSVGHDVEELLSGGVSPDPLQGLFPYTLTKPVIAAVEGQCYGLGFELALACDLRVAAGDARFGFPDTDLAVSYRLASVLLPRMTNLGAGLDLLLTGETMDAPRLERLRLVNRTAPTGQSLGRAIEIASDMSQRFGSAGAFRKEQVWQLSGLPLPTALNLARMFPSAP